MKIWKGVPGVTGVYDKNKNINKVTKASEVKSKKDVISISDKAKSYQLAMEHLKNIPDVRKEKTDEILKKMHSGNYNIDGKDVAGKIIDSIFDTKI